MGATDLLGFSIERTRNVVEFVVCASKVEEWSNPRGMNDLSRDYGGDTTRTFHRDHTDRLHSSLDYFHPPRKFIFPFDTMILSFTIEICWDIIVY